ncbi:ParA family protein [Dapis sp. BLCC M229]
MAIKIALFNHKGGVSKTTTTFNLGWMLASKGKKSNSGRYRPSI